MVVQSAPKTMDMWTASVSCVLSNTPEGRPNTPWLVGGIFVEDGKLLMTDYNNSRLLLFDDAYSCLREYKVDEKPTDIARGRFAGEVFVAVDEQYVLTCILRDGQLTKLSRISSLRDTLGIAVIGDNILVETTYCVNVLNKDGVIKKSIKTKGGITYLTVSTSKDRVYYTDSHDVVCRRLDSGAMVYRYIDAGLKDPSCIGLDRDNNVYICGRGSSNVHLVSPDGSSRRVLLPNLSGIAIPWGVVVHPTKQEFVVTSYKESTSLEVYRFSYI